MVLRAQWPLSDIAQFFHFAAEEIKKKEDKKTKAFYDWATTGIPAKSYKVEIQNGFPCIPINQESEEERGGSGACWILWQRGRALIGERAFIPGNRVSEELNLIACSSQMDIKNNLNNYKSCTIWRNSYFITMQCMNILSWIKRSNKMKLKKINIDFHVFA